MKFAVVDIETTGGSSKSRGITEIGIVITDGVQILTSWSTLVNPFEPIPPRIQVLTGITNEMVEDAPSFHDIATEVQDILADCVFVAHNVGFDYAFIRGHFEAMEHHWNRPKVCTVRLARKAFPGLPRYGLGALCDSLQIEHTNRHRALGDAHATAELLHRILQKERGVLALESALKRGTREHWMPQHVPAAEFDMLPNEPGVYWFLDSRGKPLYIGMSIHLQKRVRSHFSGSTASNKRQTLMREMRKIQHELAGSEWMALVMEDVRIRKHWPPLNKSQKQPRSYRTVVHYTDRQGRSRMVIQPHSSGRQSIRTFHSEASARAWLHEQAKTYDLDPQLLGLGSIQGREIPSLETHQDNFQLAIADWQDLPEGWFIEPGRSPVERGLIAVKNGHVHAYGFVDADDIGSDVLSHEGQQCLRELTQNLEAVAPSSALDARLREQYATNAGWIPACPPVNSQAS